MRAGASKTRFPVLFVASVINFLTHPTTAAGGGVGQICLIAGFLTHPTTAAPLAPVFVGAGLAGSHLTRRTLPGWRVGFLLCDSQ